VAPRVTVFIPTYNRARLLRFAIDSVLAQTFADFRLEISDNASADGTPDVVASFDDPRIVYIRQPENVGLLRNHNMFLERVDTEYALILSDDDLIYPGLLDRAVRELDGRASAAVVHTAFDVIGAENDVLLQDVDWTHGLTGDAVESSGEFLRESMEWSCRICESTALMRCAALPEGGMNAEDFPALDFGMWLRIAATGWEFSFLAETLAACRIHDQSHSSAYGAPQGPGYIQGIEIVSLLRAIKSRFIAANAERLEDPARLRRLAERAHRRELVLMARNTTLPERRLRPTLRALYKSGRADPGVLLESSAWRLAGASVLGSRVVDRLKARMAPSEATQPR
jgi:glycosyltransferase involved in cell wall biosynthesis